MKTTRKKGFFGFEVLRCGFVRQPAHHLNSQPMPKLRAGPI